MKWILLFLSKFLNDHGEVPDTGGEPDGEPPAGEPPAEQPEPSPGGEPSQPQKEESFIDPSTLPEELKPHWKRMHGQYTKFAQERKQLRENAALVERFNNDQAFAEQVLQQRANQLGYQLVKPGQNGITQAPATPSQGAANVPHEILQEIQNTLPPELHVIAQSIAAATMAAVQKSLAPIKEQQLQSRVESRNRDYDQHETQLTEKHPGWEEHEDEMNDIFTWLRGDSLSHPKYGSKLELLYKMATDQASSVSEATRRLNGAVRNRSSSSHTTPGSPDISKQIKQGSMHDAWEIAGKSALEDLKRQGRNI